MVTGQNRSIGIRGKSAGPSWPVWLWERQPQACTHI